MVKRDPLPKISIVTPSYNQSEYLENCILSVLSQDYPNIEYIIMDGGSSDDSKTIIEKYADRLFYWQSRKDKGQYWAINEGFQRSTGEIMTWLNSDDILDPYAFRISASLFARQPELDWITGRPASINSPGSTLNISTSKLPQWTRKTYLVDGKYKSPFIQQEGTFWRRSLWQRSGGRLDTRYSLAGDLELWTRFFRHAPLHIIDYGLAFYRVHGQNRAIKFMDQYLLEAERIVELELENHTGVFIPFQLEQHPPINKKEIARHLRGFAKALDENAEFRETESRQSESPDQLTCRHNHSISYNPAFSLNMATENPVLTTRKVKIESGFRNRYKDYTRHCKRGEQKRFVTFILPTKNRLKGVRKTLESLPAAMGDIRHEIILYADRPCQAIEAIMRRYSIKKVFYDSQVFAEGESFSWSKMMNHAFVQASGEWIMYGSDDIVFHPGCFQNALPFAGTLMVRKT